MPVLCIIAKIKTVTCKKENVSIEFIMVDNLICQMLMQIKMSEASKESDLVVVLHSRHRPETRSQESGECPQ